MTGLTRLACAACAAVLVVLSERWLNGSDRLRRWADWFEKRAAERRLDKAMDR